MNKQTNCAVVRKYSTSYIPWFWMCLELHGIHWYTQICIVFFQKLNLSFASSQFGHASCHWCHLLSHQSCSFSVSSPDMHQRFGSMLLHLFLAWTILWTYPAFLVWVRSKCSNSTQLLQACCFHHATPIKRLLIFFAHHFSQGLLTLTENGFPWWWSTDKCYYITYM